MLVVSWFISGMLFCFLYSYQFCTLVCKKKLEINWKLFFSALIIGVIYSYITNYSYDYNYIRPYVIHLYFIITFRLIYKEPIIKIILGVLCILVISCIAELIFGYIFVLGFNMNFEKLNQQFSMYMLSNFTIIAIQFILGNIYLIRNLIDGIIKWYNTKEYKSLTLFIIFVVTIAIFLLYNNFIVILPNSLLLLTNLFCVGVFIFVIGFFREKTTKNKIIYEYDQLLDYVKTYENLLEDKSKSQHEHKNQLAMIKNMSTNKKIIKYINSLLDIENEKVDAEWLKKLKYIPQGGLKGLIYYKIETMINKGVNVYLDVSIELESNKVWKNCDKNLKDISKILGVYLDNAIEACLEAKEKYIIITVALENKQIIFEISNTYSNRVDISKVDQGGYTTKGVGKGYGLSLVKDIIDTNDSLSQKRQLNGIYYVQKLYVKK